MARWHINKNGSVGVCRAEKTCPFGDMVTDHYSTAREAATAYEKKQKTQVAASVSKPSAPASPSSPPAVGVPQVAPGLRELNKLARESSEGAVLLDAAQRGSERVLTTLVQNKHTPGEALEVVAERTTNPRLATAVKRMPAYPVASLSGEEFLDTLTHENALARYKSPEVRDEHLKAVKKALDSNPSSMTPGHRVIPHGMGGVNMMLSNPANKVTAEGARKVTGGDPAYLDRLAQGNRLSGKQVAALSTHRLSRLPLSTLPEGETLTAVSQELGKRWQPQGPEAGEQGSMLSQLAKNKALPPEEVTRLAHLPERASRDRWGFTSESLHDHPQATPETRKHLVATSEHLARRERVAALAEPAGGRLALLKALTKSSSVEILGRAWTKTTYKLDPTKVEEAGLAPEDMPYLTRGMFNGSTNYNPTTYTLTGEIDSSD